MSIQESVFPSIWKKSLVLALNKFATPRSLSNFRPIALLWFLSKILERLIYNQFNDYLESRKLFEPHQSSYRKGHGTQSALIKLADDIRARMNRKLVTMLLLIEFSIAFDSVCHITFLRKQHAAGFSRSALKWIASYLSGREQAVIDDDGTRSTFSRLNTGVPQGSVLGPSLFLIFINDIGYGFSNVFYHIYADDLQLYVTFHFTELQRYVQLVEVNANIILNWANVSQLTLNFTKTKAIAIGSYYYIHLLAISLLKAWHWVRPSLDLNLRCAT